MLENLNPFNTASSFSLFIEKRAMEKHMPYMDTVLEYCAENYIDPEDIAYEDRVSGDADSYTGNGSGEDDLADYNQNEAGDYSNE